MLLSLGLQQGLQPAAAQGGPDYPVTLAEGELFLLCDARTTGADSRLYGPIPQRQVLGTALAALRRSGL